MHGALGVPPLVEPRGTKRFPYDPLQRRIFNQRTHDRGVTIYVVSSCRDGQQNDCQDVRRWLSDIWPSARLFEVSFRGSRTPDVIAIDGYELSDAITLKLPGIQD